jgi:osmotically inducible protein OsmC
MAFSNMLAQAGHTPRRVSTTANVHLDKGDKGFKITGVDLVTEADVPGIDHSKFMQIAEDAKKNCPVSQALAAIDIRLTATLVGQASNIGR